MKIGLSLPMFDLETGAPLRLSELAQFAQHAEEIGFDSVWVMDHFWLENVGRRAGGYDPMMSLAYVAARTERITLGTLVICNSFRNVGQLAREVAALADAADGRLILGIGCGWEESEHDAFGFPFKRRVDLLEETLTVLPELMAGKGTTYAGTQIQLRDANVITGASGPPLWLAAFGPRLIRLTSRFADGWNTAWHGPDTTTFEREYAALSAGLSSSGRDPRDVTISVGLWMLPVSGEDLEQAELRAESLKPADAPTSWPSPVRQRTLTGTTEELANAVRRYAALGAGHIILNLSVSPFSLFDPTYIDRAAQVVRAIRNSSTAGSSVGP
jgi:alkanesulfonate monooxygenase SsuD/methylene tetrahydromethanopterin reductase-like flavin-dependent oxidoreductase (luciferase family)